MDLNSGMRDGDWGGEEVGWTVEVCLLYTNTYQQRTIPPGGVAGIRSLLWFLWKSRWARSGAQLAHLDCQSGIM